MSEVDSGYEVTGIRSLGLDIIKVILSKGDEDGFAITIIDYSAVSDEDFDDILRDAVDARLDELEIKADEDEARRTEEESHQARKGWKAKKTVE